MLMALVIFASCEDPREWRSRQAVRQLVKATPLRATAAMDRVVTIGCYALVDIEQALHNAPLSGRLRLLEVIERARCREAIPLLRFLERWDDEKDVKKLARRIRQRFERASPPSS
ncbi:MAG: hypothetical protein CSA65_02180 [Proteobacteria bacterium]|nr:MAG: hypothetical protein CSA65_02180 [Pseudomonadota bacterium]